MKSKTIARNLLAIARRRWGFITIGVLVCGAAAWFLPGRSRGIEAAAYHEVKRGDFLISVVEGGTIEAVNEVFVRSDVEGTARIITIVPEGSYVKKGQLLIELDSSAAQDQVNQQMLNFERARFALVQAKEQLTIQRSVVESDIRAAELRLEFAKADLKKYVEGEALQSRRNLTIELSTVKENLVLAQQRLEWSEKLHAKGFETKSNLDKDRLAVSQYVLRQEQAEKALWMFDTFDFPKGKRQAESSVEEAQASLERVKLQSDRRLASYEAEVKSQENTVDLNRKKLERDQANLVACKIMAPQDGLVVYNMSNNRFSSESLIEAGAMVRNRQDIIKLPDISQLKLSIKIHESHVNMVKAGQEAYVVLDSMPDKRFKGVVSKVGILPDSQSRWGNPNLKLYATEIVLTEQIPGVKPGVSARAEVVITNIEDALTVPLQAVTTRQGRQVAYVAAVDGVKAVPVQVGLYNSKNIQVLSGLRDGDRVLLAPPLDDQEKDLGGAILAEKQEKKARQAAKLSAASSNEVTAVREPIVPEPAASLAVIDRGDAISPKNETPSDGNAVEHGKRGKHNGEEKATDANAAPASAEVTRPTRATDRAASPGTVRHLAP
jgi:HlyD family secretion protein